MKFQLSILLLIFSISSYGQMAELIVDLAKGPLNGISEEATVLGTLESTIIINNEANIYCSDGTFQGSKYTYELTNSEIIPGVVNYEGELFMVEFTSSDTSRILKVNSTGTVEVVLEEAGAIELYLAYKDKLYYNRRSDFTEFLYSYDPQTENIEEILELKWSLRDGLKDAIVFNDLIYMIVWPEEMSGSHLASYDGEGNVEFLHEFFSSNVDDSSRRSIQMTVADSNLFFWFGEGTDNTDLYVTDGKEDGTQVLQTDFKRFVRTESLRTIGTVGDIILFQGLDADNDRHLWSSDGTTSGTFKIEQEEGIDINPSYFTEHAGKLAFCGYHGSQPFGAPDLATLQTDGTVDGTITLLNPDEIPGPSINNGYWLTSHNDSLFMVGRKQSFPFDNDLYKSDGTPDGTVKVSSIGEEAGNDISHITSANNKLYFFGTTDSLGRELYVYSIAAVDQDGDGFTSDVDCDDNNADVNPDQQEEPYNGIDDDCDPGTLDDDLDQDGFLLVDDCNDLDSLINPAAMEIPDNDIDENCDGVLSTHELSNSKISIYPNPVSDIIYIDVEGQLNFQINLYDLNGMLISSESNVSQLEVANAPSGTYLLEIIDIKTGQKVVERIVK